jgi:hypothetical protein
MAREKEGYRDNLELLNTMFPDKGMLTFKDVMQLTGWKKRETVARNLGSHFTGNLISKTAVARWMCG